MKDHPVGSVGSSKRDSLRLETSVICRPAMIMAAVVSALATITLAADYEYIHEDVKFSGKEIVAFRDGGESVSAVFGDFKLTVGDRTISGRDGVVWIFTNESGSIPRYDISVYVDGDAKVVEPGGTTSDVTMFVTLHSDGRIVAKGKLTQRDMKDSPLYARALEAREMAENPPSPPAQSPPSEPPPTETPAPAQPSPENLLTWAKVKEGQTQPTEPAPPPATGPAESVEAASQPAKAGEPAIARMAATAPMVTTAPVAAIAPVAATVTTTAPAGKAVATAKAPPEGQPAVAAKPLAKAPPKPPPRPMPIDYHYDEMTSEMIGAGPGQRRVTVLRGHVRLGVGESDSDLYLELRADEAVVFSKRLEPNAPAKDTRFPRSVDIGKIGGKTGGEAPEGVYLEGDVVISRGERSFRGPVAYYDFATDRAIVLNPVFHSVQEQRNIPIYVRAKEARMLSAREYYFRNAKVSISEFYTPSYSIGASKTFLKDTTPYDEKGVALGPQSYQAEMKHTTFNVDKVPIFYWPWDKTDFTQGPTPLRTVRVGRIGDMGFGVETEWNLFRLLGLVPPEGFKGIAEFNWYKRGPMASVDIDYARKDYSGYVFASGIVDQKGKDKFGNAIGSEDIPAPSERGRLLIRHKQILPGDIELQAEMSWISDRNYMEAFYPAEYFAGKEQETLLYAKKQKDNWAVTGLLQYRLNRFDTQTESWPEVAFFLVGQPLLGDRLTYFNESRLGAKRWRPANYLGEDDSDVLGRADTRNELDLPLHVGPMNLVTYAVGRATYWGDTPDGGSEFRPYGQIGQRVNTHIWRVYDEPSSRIWDIRRLKHIITPEATIFATGDSVDPNDLFPMDPGIEQHLTKFSGGSIGLLQRLQTKRGTPGVNERTVDWMRLNVVASFYSDDANIPSSNGQFFWYRPEYSIARDNIETEYDWQISDTTAFLSSFNYDIDRSIIGKADAGIAITRDPRLRYYLGWRYLKDANSSLVTFGVNYKLSKKYTISFFEQYDLDFKGGQNQTTNLSIIRQLPRWYAGVTFTYLQGQDTGNNVGIMLTLWPEGIPEVRLGSNRMNMLGESSRN